MFKNYIIIDNILNNPKKIRNQILSLPFNTVEDFDLPGVIAKKQPLEATEWRGFRTDDFSKAFPKEYTNLLHSIFDRVFDMPYELMAGMLGHISTARMNSCVEESSKWHIDKFELIAGVIYLNENPEPGSGTWLRLENQELYIENKFNRLLLYKSHIYHKPGVFFGNTALNSRLTLTLFLSGIKFLKNGSVAEPGLLQRS